MSSPSGPDRPATVLARSDQGTWAAAEKHGYVNEAELQAMLLDSPSLIEGIDEDAIAVREFATGVGPADLVIIDGTGALTVVECKLATNSEVRREIVGQVLDYAARLAETTPDVFAERWATRRGPSLNEFFDARPGSRERFESDLAAGVFTLVLAVDRIHEDLRRIVRYLNQHTSAGMRLLAIELNRLKSGETEILVPTVYGRESADQKDARSSGSTRRWTHADVDADLRPRNATLADAVRAFETELGNVGFRVKGGGSGAVPSYSIWGRTVGDGDIAPFSVYCGERPTLSCNFEWSRAATPDRLTRFVDALVSAGVVLPREEIVRAEFRRRPSVPLDVLLEPDRRAAVVAAAAELAG